MQIGHLELFAEDAGRTADFYLNVLGFQPVVQQPGNLHWIGLKQQEVLIRPSAKDSAPPPAAYGQSAMAVVLYTDDLDGSVDRLRAAGVEVVALEGRLRGFAFRDPDGRWIQIVDPAERG